MSKQRTRRQFTSEQKVAILKRHLVDKVGVSDVCDEYQLQPSQFYEWQRKLMENAALSLSTWVSPSRAADRYGSKPQHSTATSTPAKGESAPKSAGHRTSWA